MYIIEFRESWMKKEGKLTFCKVRVDGETQSDTNNLIDQYTKDLTALIEIKIARLQKKYKVAPDDIRKIKDLVDELKQIDELRWKE